MAARQGGPGHRPIKARGIKRHQQPELTGTEIAVGDVLRLRDLSWLPEGNAVYRGVVVVPADPAPQTRWQRFTAAVRRWSGAGQVRS